MNAGSELDALIAEKVMNLEHRDWKPYCAPEGWYPKDAPNCNERDDNDNAIDHPGYFSDLPCFSTNIADAWLVVEQMKANKWEFFAVGRSDDQRGPWFCQFARQFEVSSKEVTAYADTAPLAICLAALKAMEDPS